MIGGGGEQLTLRSVARVGDLCNLFGDPATVKQKLEVLRRHCEKEKRDFAEIERTNTTAFLIARDDAAVRAKRAKYGLGDQFRGHAITVPQVIDLVGQFKDAGVQTLIFSTYKNDQETLDLFAEDVMPKIG